jgi:MerR family transcriptional regulator, light-induced transcriptional regulator
MLYPLKSLMAEETSHFLTTRQLARMWSVSEASIKRWADAGHLRTGRTVGGHRRFSLAEAARFQRERGLGAAARGAEGALEPAALGAAEFDAESLAEQFFEAIRAGQEGVSTALLLEAHLAGAGTALLLDEVVAPAMRRVGDLWHAGEVSVAEEHLATRAATRAVEALAEAARRAEPGARSAVVCAVEDEFHQLAVLCAQAALEAEGWSVKNLGAHTPFFALADFVERHAPALVCASSTTNAGLARGARDYAQFLEAARARGARVVLGGAGFEGEDVRRQFPADLHAGSFRELAEFAREGRG